QEKIHDIEKLQGELEQAHARTDVELAWRTKALNDELFETRLKLSQYLQQKYDHDMNDVAWEDLVSQQAAVSKIDGEAGDVPAFFLDAGASDMHRLKFMLQKESYRNATEVCEAQVEICESRLKELEMLKNELPEKLSSAMGIKHLETQLQKNKSDVVELEQQRTIRQLTSAHYGTVGVFQHVEGELLTAGEPVVELLDQDRRYLEVQVPSQRIAEFSAGARVSLSFSGDVTRTGQIRSIPPQAKHSKGEFAMTNAVDIPVTLIIDPVGLEWPRSPIGSTVEVTLNRNFDVR
ncbi:MAG: HlyD family efflux transporter periplasmic adaptor subunit, partial [Planctomycetaceae bacterium]